MEFGGLEADNCLGATTIVIVAGQVTCFRIKDDVMLLNGVDFQRRWNLGCFQGVIITP
jgi:hypothetical protein